MTEPVDFVTKPFEPEDIVVRVHTHLKVQRLQRQLAGRNAELSASWPWRRSSWPTPGELQG